MKERTTEMKGNTGIYNPVTSKGARVPHPLNLLPSATSFGRNHPNLAVCQGLHHRLVALTYGEKLRDLNVSASAHVSSRRLSHRLPELWLLGFPLAAVAEEVLPCVEHCPNTPPAFVVISVAEPFQVDSSGRMPGTQSVYPGGLLLYACHRARSVGPCLALEAVAEVLAALVGLPSRLSC